MENDSFVLLVHLCSGGLKSSGEGEGEIFTYLFTFSMFLVYFSDII